MKLIKENPEMVFPVNRTIKQALKAIDTSAEGLLFVVDTENRYLGTLSDGDLRRAIIAGQSLDDLIITIYNAKSYFIRTDQLNDCETKDIMIKKRFRVVPVVSDDCFILGYITWDDISPNIKRSAISDRLNLPVVIMAGGKGTRMAPFTNVLPKPLVPIGNKTILEVIIDEFLPYGVNEFYFTINYRGEMIRAYFDCIERDYSVRYLREDEFYGTAGSLSLMPKTVSSTFIVTNCDIIVKANYSNVIKFHKQTGALLTVLSAIKHYKIPYGIIKYTAGGFVTEIEEKPEISMCVNTGVYILEPECLKYIPDKTVFHMTNLIEELIRDNKKVSTYPVNESEYIDIGQWEEYNKAVDAMK